MSAAEWLERYGVAFDWRADGFHSDASGWEHHLYTLELASSRAGAGDPLEVSWRQGMAVDDEPTPARVMWALAADARYGLMSWEDFADEFGFDVHDAPLSSYRSWEACRDFAAKLRDFCEPLEGDAFGEFLELEDES